MKTIRVLAYEIEYDTDGVSVQYLRNQGAYLPQELWLNVNVDDITEEKSNEIADAISDVTGWCVNTFQFKAYSK